MSQYCGSGAPTFAVLSVSTWLAGSVLVVALLLAVDTFLFLVSRFAAFAALGGEDEEEARAGPAVVGAWEVVDVRWRVERRGGASWVLLDLRFGGMLDGGFDGRRGTDNVVERCGDLGDPTVRNYAEQSMGRWCVVRLLRYLYMRWCSGLEALVTSRIFFGGRGGGGAVCRDRGWNLTGNRGFWVKK